MAWRISIFVSCVGIRFMAKGCWERIHSAPEVCLNREKHRCLDYVSPRANIAAASQEDTVTASGRKAERGQGVVILFDQERSLEFEQYSDDLDVSSFAASWASPARGETVPRGTVKSQ